MKNKIKIYVSHSIRGLKGADATDEDMRINNRRATAFGKILRSMFPKIDFYVPADGDEFVLIAHRKKYLTEKQILDVDCGIVDTCNAVLAYIPDQYISNGMLVEIYHAHSTNKPVLLMKSWACGSTIINRYLEQLKT